MQINMNDDDEEEKKKKKKITQRLWEGRKMAKCL